ncbi:MAG: class I SAM-dependent methyltransferase [Acidobacteriia bacterium]|nr:class I SAM-dependent methyltransferase [Terriglobia bacterium]
MENIYREIQGEDWNYEFQSNQAWKTAREFLAADLAEATHVNVLDIGCSSGRFLKELPRSWNKYGIEPSIQHRDELKGYGIQVIAQSLMDPLTDWRGKFDAVCMFDVFEHLFHPFDDMLKALQLLRPGGKLLLSTGNMESFQWKWLGVDHWYLDSPLHISFGSKQFFSWVVQRAPVRIIRCKKISHRHGEPRQVLRDRIISAYFGFRIRGGIWRIPQRMIQSTSKFRDLMHKINPPYTFFLRDHLLIEFESVQSVQSRDQVSN